jgi:lysozyme
MNNPLRRLLRRALSVGAAGLALLMLLPSTSVSAHQTPNAAVQAVSYLEGIDVSNWQGRPRWRQVRDAGVQFVIAKASEGRTWTDGQYARNHRLARKLGIPFTAYHFARPGKGAKDAIIEADNFVAAAQLRGRDLVPVLDLEDNGGLGVRRLRRWVKTWLQRVESRVGVKPMIYASPMFWAKKMGDSTWFANNGYRLWVAHWGVDQPDVPAANWGGNGWTIWQYDNCGAYAGINGCVDTDRFSGSDLSALTIANNR